MSWLEVIAVALVLTLDASALTLADAAAYRGGDIRKLIVPPLLLGFFQGIMPVAGYFIMTFAGFNLGAFSGLLVFLILSFIGFRLIFSYFRPDKKSSGIKNDLPVTFLVRQAVLAGADAFAVGVGLAVKGGAIFVPSLIFASVTASVCLAFLFVGRRLVSAAGGRELIVGGILIIAVGIKNLLG